MRKNIVKICMIIIGVLCVFFIYEKCIEYHIIKETANQPPIVFSVIFRNGDKGTYKYNIKSKKIEKISDFIFYELSYSEDYEKIIGVIWEDRFQGIAELDMKDYTFKPIIDIDTLNVLGKKIGLDELKYDFPGVTDIYVPKYYKDGYTFLWEYGANDIWYINKVTDEWNMTAVNKSEFPSYTYFIKQGEIDLLFLESTGRLFGQEIGRGTIVEKTMGEDDEKGILDIGLTDAIDLNGLMDMPKDMSKIVYYEEPEIYIYDLNTKKKKHVTNQFLFNQYVLELKFSSDGSYVFYTVGDIPFFGGYYYRRSFFIVDLKTGDKVKLAKWKNGDRFYGIDW